MNLIIKFVMLSINYDVDIGSVMLLFCMVMVFDGELIDIVILNVIIDNINDNILIFIVSLYLFFVFFIVDVGIIIVSFFVMDGDIGIFGKCFLLIFFRKCLNVCIL